MRQMTGRSLVTAVSANVYLAGGVYADECGLAPNGVDCIPNLPNFQAITVLAGWENTSATLRAMAGPAYIRDLDTDASTFGVQGRADAALRLVGPFDFVLSVRGTVIPSLHSNAIQYLTLGAGLRLR
jgi:hypothetical protein